MSTPHLRIVSDQVAEQANDAMAELGGMTIDGLLGTYQANKDDVDALLAEALQLHDANELQTDRSLMVWGDLERAQRRLWLYSVLGNEAFG